MRTAAAVALALAACSSASPPAEHPAPPAAVPGDAAAAPDAVPPDANLADVLADAPAWVFRYSSPQRNETWTLRYRDGNALLVTESAQGTTRYTGTATDGASLVLDVSTRTAKMKLDCKHAKRAIGAKCNDAKARPIELLDCFHPDFKEPMPFGAAPGVEYSATPACTGYRLVAP